MVLAGCRKIIAVADSVSVGISSLGKNGLSGGLCRLLADTPPCMETSEAISKNTRRQCFLAVRFFDIPRQAGVWLFQNVSRSSHKRGAGFAMLRAKA